MVLLTIVTTSNPHTVYFDHDLMKPSYIRLLSASIYNSWNNSKEEAVISTTAGSNGSTTKVNLLPGHHIIDSSVKEFNEIKKNRPNLSLTAVANTPVGSMTIFNQNNVKFSNNLSELLGIKNTLPFIAFIKRLTSPSTYFIHCDLVDKDQNLLNGKPLTVLARFDIRGKPFERANYQTTQQHVLRDASSCNYANSITLSVRDENNNLFDFNNMPLEFELEMN